MANHVNNYITVMGTEEVEKVFDSLGENFTVTIQRPNWEGVNTNYTEFKGIEELEFMPEYDEESSYNWYMINVGAKWCHIEEWEGDYMNLCSAWSACTEFTERLTTFLAKTDPDVEVRHQYEDEFRNFIGVAVYKGLEANEILFEEMDDEDLTDLFKHEHPEFDHDAEEMTGEMHEAFDDLVYDWFDSQNI